MAEPAYLTETFVPKPEKITGGILYAPAGTVVPTNAKDKLNAAFTELGYVRRRRRRMGRRRNPKDSHQVQRIPQLQALQHRLPRRA